MIKKTINKIGKDNENGARRAVIEDLFYDFNRSRAQVYWLSFFRGIFFGVGTVIGGTIVVALVVWFLNLFADLPGGFGDFISYVVQLVENAQK